MSLICCGSVSFLSSINRAAAAKRAVETTEFHRLLASVGADSGRPSEVKAASSRLQDGAVGEPSGAEVHQFRWRGVINGG